MRAVHCSVNCTRPACYAVGERQVRELRSVSVCARVGGALYACRFPLRESPSNSSGLRK